MFSNRKLTILYLDKGICIIGIFFHYMFIIIHCARVKSTESFIFTSTFYKQLPLRDQITRKTSHARNEKLDTIYVYKMYL